MAGRCVVVTLIINLVLFPLRFTSLKSARKMQKLQPKIKEINERFKNVKINDPRKAEQNQEVMALYKKEGVNPVGGCLPMVIQLPFLYAFYRVLSIAIELRHAPWLWVTRSFGAGNLTDSLAAGHSGSHAVSNAKDDTGRGG